MTFKPGCSLLALQPPTIVAMLVAQAVYLKNGYELVVTSVNDSTHSEKSLHYNGLAIDCRIKTLPPEIWQKVRDEIKAGLTSEFDVILEKDHIHIEYDPKRPSAQTRPVS